MKIRHKTSGAVIYDGPFTDLSKANMVEANLSEAYLHKANLSKANMAGADLSKAILSNANLSEAILIGANLSEANLSRANMVGAILADGVVVSYNNDVFSLGPLGSRRDTLHVFHTNVGPYFFAGCFSGTLDEFKCAVYKKHSNTAFKEEYLAAIKFVCERQKK